MLSYSSHPVVLRRWFSILGLIFLFTALASAQFDTGTIAGSVVDPSGAVVPAATVTITNVGTGLQKKLETDTSGNFVAAAMPLGNYVVTASAGGFVETKSPEIRLNVGGTVKLNLTLNVAGVEQAIEVTGTTTTVAIDTTTTGSSLDSNQIANLPVNGRDVSSFLQVAAGAVASTGFFQGSINGLDNIFTGLNITLDGQNASRGDINGFLSTQGQEQSRVTRASIDSIQEINFSNNGYNAQAGFSLGPQMDIITKPGSNNYHGTLFEYFRNDALDAHDYFETGKKQPLRLNQFGANLGGPLVRNKLFFFANYEGVRQRITNFNALNHTLSAYARSQFQPSMQAVLDQLAPLPAGCTAIPAPESCVYPGFDSGTEGGSNMVYDPAVLPTTLREDTGSLRVDYNISDKDRLFGRYNIGDSLTNYTYGMNVGQVSPQALRTQRGKIDETHTFGPTLLNEFSIGLNRFYSDTNSNTPTPLVGFSGFFTDLGSLPGPNSFNQITPFSVFEVFDTVTKTVKDHTLKFGVQIRVNRLNEWLRPQQTFSFGSVHDLQYNAPFVLSKIGFPGFVGVRNSNWGFHFQDDWRVTRNLTVNLGLRYDFNTVWREGQDRAQNFDVATQSFLPADQAPYKAPKSDIAPRIGFSYDPFGKGKTVIHGYGGLFYMPMQFGFGLVTNLPELSSYSVNVFQAPLAYPMENPPLPAGTQNVVAFAQNPKDPYSTNWLFGIQQEVADRTILTVNYTGNKTAHMQSGVSYAALNANPANPFTQARPYSGFANENVADDSLFSNYNALQVQLKRNIGKLNLEANYTWSHEIDDLVNVFGGFSNPYDPNTDRGSGDWDVRHNFTTSLVYSLPEFKQYNGLVRGVLGGWQTSSIIQTRSGLPTNVQLVSGFFGNPVRPNYVPGVSPWLSSVNWPFSSYNVAAFTPNPSYDGTPGENLGTVERNALRGPGFFQWDFSVMKNFGVTENTKLQFRVDLFNILNHPNFANPDAGICTAITPASGETPAGCTVNTNFGKVGQTIADNMGSQIGTGTARQAQFSLKFIF
ncbi:MAG: TonB-dependent receptor [Acidobacteria bacterium]|nr:TonB-dependent receptor [Acidobacteriota bacterium]